MIAANDGVGTKLRIAIEAGRHDTVGIDLVAMCVNDLVVQGAEPLFFLDYLATGKLAVESATEIVSGIAEGCRQAGCALIGGETAEMPGMYAGDDYDLAGFAVGAVERARLLTGATIQPGDRVLGLASTGLHSNGFSLVRKLVESHGLAYGDAAPFEAGSDLATQLLTPTRIYVAGCLAGLRTGLVKGLAHITGGGLWENIPRVLPTGCAVELDAANWPAPPVFGWLAGIGGITPDEMALTFNCGIGMAVFTAEEDAADLSGALESAGETVFDIGRVVEFQGDRPVHIASLEALCNG